MVVVFRLQGLDGEATEETVDSLEETAKEEEDPVQKYALTQTLAEAGGAGLSTLVAYVGAVAGLLGEADASERANDWALLRDTLQLVRHCCHLQGNRRCLADHGALRVLLGALQRCAHSGGGQGGAGEEAVQLLLSIAGQVAGEQSIETPAAQAGAEDDSHLDSCLGHLTMLRQKHASALRSRLVAHSRRSRKGLNPQEVHLYDVLRLVAAVSAGGASGLRRLVGFFVPVANRLAAGEAEDAEDTAFLTGCFAAVLHDLPASAGGSVKQQTQDLGLPERLAAQVCATVEGLAPKKEEEEGGADADPRGQSLIAALRLLEALVGAPGVCPEKALAAVRGSLEALHKVECWTSRNREEEAGAAAAVLDALEKTGDESVSALRSETTKSKHAAAMAQRDRLLKSLGLQEGGGPDLDLDSIDDEDGLACLVCREGAISKPREVLGLYVFARRVEILANAYQGKAEEFRLADLQPVSRVSTYSCVTHFNAIHYTCHKEASRVDAQSRPHKSEWQGATERNLKTQCNAILPLRPPEPAAAAAAAGAPRSAVEQQYQRLLGNWSDRLAARGGGILSAFEQSVYDVRMLMSRVVWGHSYARDSNGGNAEHNLCALPFFVQVSLSLLHSPPSPPKVDERGRAWSLLMQFLLGHATPALFNISAPSPPQLSAETVFYLMSLSLLLMDLDQWNHNKMALVRSLVAWLVSSHAVKGKAKPLQMVFADVTPPPAVSSAGSAGVPSHVMLSMLDFAHVDPHGESEEFEDDFFDPGDDIEEWAASSPPRAEAAAAAGSPRSAPAPTDVTSEEGLLHLLKGPLRFVCTLDAVQYALKEPPEGEEEEGQGEVDEDEEEEAGAGEEAEGPKLSVLPSARWLRQLRRRLENDQQRVVDRMRDVREQITSEIIEIDSLQEFFDTLGILADVLGEASSPEEWVRQFLR
eukprot:Hpha_TRINITY_DN16695_c7_g2::TRINITY_DN16695_c7_g2_i3::g.182567::m.182567/K10691/UBR4, ZUBR1; E3 ubiquitin-protein ligase UBR4